MSLTPIAPDQAARLLQASYVSGYRTAWRLSVTAIGRLRNEIGPDDIDEWVAGVPFDEEDVQALAEFAGTLLMARFEGELREAGLSVGGAS